ncbi:anthranilate phosphoribosyltransferase [Psychrosphaera sp. B3R10]|uniref:anthranilate phosphoribosyltransferase n=1 Tax=unclassified Psychrosphaera TaxID=2641570 RepID=UPI001C0A0CF4|nr:MULTISPECIES: anthranilate phosphoribosyltransferase [unclassified Psychrosphaera]MBU2882395.1 anthranilate phosphoribosyltransferase [Psychrosphaera sp. I2R16]MBU2989076.1 anthranilate phosphoribosyltransferase [Psychrosphaera sp. B3R10]
MKDIDLIHNVMANNNLSAEQTEQLFTSVVKGQMEDIHLSALLTALKMKGETPDEIAGAAAALSGNALPFPIPNYPTADNCGTGGDGTHTINISTISAILGAACGVKMAKHGNRKVSSKSGSADVLSELGIKLDMTPEHARKCLDETNLTFLMAPVYHAGIRFAMPVRQALETRTIFNILGPLVNPAKSEIKVIGVYSEHLCRPLAETLKLLGKKAAWIVHGSGMDEIAVHGPSKVVQLLNGEITEFELTPQQFGFKQYALSDLQGGTPVENAANIKQVLAGDGIDAHNTAVILNTAPVLFLSGLVDSFEAAIALAKSTLLSGAGLTTLNHFVALSAQDQ